MFHNLNLTIIFPLFATLIFFFLSVIFYLLNISGILQIIPPILFFITMTIFFIKFVFKNNILLIYPWFLAAAGLFIGLGSLGSYLRYEKNLIFLDKMTTISFANILNSTSLIIILVVCHFCLKKVNFNKISINLIITTVLNYKKIGFSSLCIFFILKILISIFYEQNILLLSIISKLTILENGLIFILSILLVRLSYFEKSIFLIYLILQFLFLLTFLSKFMVLKFLILIILGIWINSKRKIYLGTIFSIFLIVIFYVLNPIVNIGRSHNYYVENRSDLISKLEIINDTFSVIFFGSNSEVEKNFYKSSISVYKDLGYYETNIQNKIVDIYTNLHSRDFNIDKMEKTIEFLKNNHSLEPKYNTELDKYVNKIRSHELNVKQRLINILNRLDVISTQRFIYKEYITGKKGNTLDNIMYIFVPRIIWKDKPVMTNYGIYLHNLFDNGNRPKSDLKFQYSSLGPSNHGEAFWNHGIFGLITISVVIGLSLSLLTNFFSYVVNTKYILSYLIIFPGILNVALFYESWIVSFLGEIIILISIFLISIPIINLFSKINILNNKS